MPVLAYQQQTRGAQPGAIARIEAPRMDEGRTWGRVAELVSRSTAEVARTLASAEEEKAVAWATQAVINADESGIPQIPARETAWVSAAARRAADDTIRQRMEVRFGRELENRLEQARDRNQYDPQGFGAEANAIVNGFISSVPEAFRGAVGDFAESAAGQIAGRIGYNAGQLQRSNANADWRVASERFFSEAERLGIVDDEGGALAQLAEAEALGASLIAQQIISPLEYQKTLSTMRALHAAGDLQRQAADMPLDELDATVNGLMLGTDQKLAARFPTPEGRRAVARVLSTLLGRRRAASAAAAKETKERIDVSAYLAGGMDATKKAAETGDVAVARVLGQGGAVTAEFWRKGGMSDAVAWSAVSRSGIMPESMATAFRQVARGVVPVEEAEAVFRAWRELSDGYAPDGSAVRMIGQVPDAANGLMMQVEALTTSGGLSFEEAWIQARQVEVIDDEALFGRMVSAGAIDAEAGARLSPDTIGRATRAYLTEKLSDDLGVAVGRDTSNLAHSLFQRVMSAPGVDAGDAYTLVLKQMEHRYPPSVFLAEGRGWAAPETLYRVASDPVHPFGETAYGAVMDIHEAFIQPMGGEKIARVEPWFNGWARARLKSIGVEGGPGKDWWLVPTGADRARPDYKIMTVDAATGIPAPAFLPSGDIAVLSPFAAWQAANTAASAAIADQERKALEDAEREASEAVERRAARQRAIREKSDRAMAIRDQARQERQGK